MADTIKHSPEYEAHKTKNLSPEEMREFARKGGIASQKVQHHKRSFREAVEWAMQMPAQDVANFKNKLVNQIVKDHPDLTVSEAMAITTAARAIKDGDAKAMAILRDTVGELPAQTVKLQHNDPISITIRTVADEEPATESTSEEEPANEPSDE